MNVFGFIKSPEDKRDTIFSSNNTVPEEYYLKNVDKVIDQGNDPVCAAISIHHIINWQNKAIGEKSPSFKEIYKLKPDPSGQGMVPRDALKALKKEGINNYHINAYAKITSAESAKKAIMINGPIMVGFIAYNENRFWEPGAQEIGGHAVILTGWDENGFVMQNSWGTTWGNAGKMIFPENDWKHVLEAWTIFI